MRKELDYGLLQRSTRRVSATSGGERYAARCKMILDLVAEAEGEAGGERQLSGRLRVMSMAAFGNRYVTPLVATYCMAYPQVTVEYSSSQSASDLLARFVDAKTRAWIDLLKEELPDAVARDMAYFT